MGKYCILNDPAADQTVQDVLDMVVEEVVILMGQHVQAIVLMGGYGRGEGGVYRSSAGYRLVNDLDLAVFVEKDFRRVKQTYTRPLKALAVSLRPQARGIKQIDIDITNTLRHRLKPNVVVNYELKNGHKIIYGNLALRKIMPELIGENLPVFDGTIYFYSRGSGLLLPALYLKKNMLDLPAVQENFQIELQKACQAMGDALLLKMKRYHYSYRKRLHRFKCLGNVLEPEIKSLYDDIRTWYCWAVQKKLSPKMNWPGNEQMNHRFFEIRDVFSRFFLWFESNRMNRAFKGWSEYCNFIYNNGLQEPWDLKITDVVKRSLQAKKPVLKTKIADLLPVMPLLLFGFKEADKGGCLAQAQRLMGISDSANGDWLSLTRAYLERFHAGGVVADALRL